MEFVGFRVLTFEERERESSRDVRTPEESKFGF